MLDQDSGKNGVEGMATEVQIYLVPVYWPQRQRKASHSLMRVYKTQSNSSRWPSLGLVSYALLWAGSFTKGWDILITLAGILGPPCGKRLRGTAPQEPHSTGVDGREWMERKFPQRNFMPEEGAILDRPKQQMFTTSRLELLLRPSHTISWERYLESNVLTLAVLR